MNCLWGGLCTCLQLYGCWYPMHIFATYLRYSESFATSISSMFMSLFINTGAIPTVFYVLVVGRKHCCLPDSPAVIAPGSGWPCLGLPLSNTRSVAEMEVAGWVTRQEAVRSRAVGLLETGAAQTAVAKKLGVHRITVCRWWKRCCEGKLADKKRSDRAHTTCLKSLKIVCAILPAREGRTSGYRRCG